MKRDWEIGEIGDSSVFYKQRSHSAYIGILACSKYCSGFDVHGAFFCCFFFVALPLLVLIKTNKKYTFRAFQQNRFGKILVSNIKFDYIHGTFAIATIPIDFSQFNRMTIDPHQRVQRKMRRRQTQFFYGSKLWNDF